jgi:hypothetical protein
MADEPTPAEPPSPSRSILDLTSSRDTTPRPTTSSFGPQLNEEVPAPTAGDQTEPQEAPSTDVDAGTVSPPEGNTEDQVMQALTAQPSGSATRVRVRAGEVRCMTAARNGSKPPPPVTGQGSDESDGGGSAMDADGDTDMDT